MYTTKQLAELAGVSRRTLHYYDELGLLKPAKVGNNSYRYFDDENLFQLQQILFYRELGLELKQIKLILEDPDFDRISALQEHRHSLQDRVMRLKKLIQTVDNTVMHFLGEVNLSNKNLFEGFSKEEQEKYEKEAIDQWGEEAVQSINLWNSYSEERKAQIMDEGSLIYQEIVETMDKGEDSPEVQALLVRWHDHLRYFYEPTIEILEGLGKMYHDHPDFNATFTKFHPDLPAFLKKAIAIYADNLVTESLEEELE
jgi:DNA-binding transcriptional MerR regulator